MKAKKLLAIFFTLVMTACLMAGCGSSNGSQSDANSVKATTAEETENNNGDKNSETTKEANKDNSTSEKGGKTLVVYYSATGTTKGVAETIAKVTGGDLFEIEPKEAYTSDDLDWTNSDSRVSKEHDNESLRDVELVSTKVDNWDSYNTVYIGYPIWWGIAAWPVNGFVKVNDFSGKTVIPFCTAASSGIGESGNLLKEIAGTGDWKDGEVFRGGASESDIGSWIDSLGL